MDSLCINITAVISWNPYEWDGEAIRASLKDVEGDLGQAIGEIGKLPAVTGAIRVGVILHEKGG
ncbi:hypothetical protein LCGC14_1330130 [marine sediment metagenome]|uniref:Uncharacterized protein n=1 Tax=marine sediment metagenome TaxID=412755 RepID=A0A0F9KGV6_9ZZZZ